MKSWISKRGSLHLTDTKSIAAWNGSTGTMTFLTPKTLNWQSRIRIINIFRPISSIIAFLRRRWVSSAQICLSWFVKSLGWENDEHKPRLG